MKKLNLIALLVFLAGAIGFFVLPKETLDAVQARVTAIFTPFIHASAKVEGAFESTVDGDIDPQTLRAEHERLKIENQGLKLRVQQLDRVQAENGELRNALGYMEASPFKLTPARVIKRSAETWWNTIIIDKGSLDGIGTDCPVIVDKERLVGKTGKVSAHTTTVILLTDERCRVSATIEGTREKGILAGVPGGTDLRPDLRLRFLSRNASVNVGANVYTSGDGGVFPSGLHLGVVKRFENREISGEAVVEPLVDLEQVRHLFVVEMQKKEAGIRPVETAKQP